MNPAVIRGPTLNRENTVRCKPAQTQAQEQEQANTRVDYRNANVSADARNEEKFHFPCACNCFTCEYCRQKRKRKQATCFLSPTLEKISRHFSPPWMVLVQRSVNPPPPPPPPLFPSIFAFSVRSGERPHLYSKHLFPLSEPLQRFAGSHLHTFG